MWQLKVDTTYSLYKNCHQTFSAKAIKKTISKNPYRSTCLCKQKQISFSNLHDDHVWTYICFAFKKSLKNKQQQQTTLNYTTPLGNHCLFSCINYQSGNSVVLWYNPSSKAFALSDVRMDKWLAFRGKRQSRQLMNNVRPGWRPCCPSTCHGWRQSCPGWGRKPEEMYSVGKP